MATASSITSIKGEIVARRTHKPHGKQLAAAEEARATVFLSVKVESSDALPTTMQVRVDDAVGSAAAGQLAIAKQGAVIEAAGPLEPNPRGGFTLVATTSFSVLRTAEEAAKAKPPDKPGRGKVPMPKPADLRLLASVEAACAAAGLLLELPDDIEGSGPNDIYASDEDGEGEGEGEESAASSALVGPLHPLNNLPGRELLPGGGPSTSFEQRKRYLQERKGPQVDWCLRAVAEAGRDFRHIVDIGGGRADLAMALAATAKAKEGPAVVVTVIDINEPSLEAGRARAEALGLSKERIRFLHLDITKLLPSSSPSFSSGAGGASGAGADSTLLTADDGCTPLPKPDLFIGLHACGCLSDTVIALAQLYEASFLLVPCCFCKNSHLRPHAGDRYWPKSLPPIAGLSSASTTGGALAVDEEKERDKVRDTLLRLAENYAYHPTTRAVQMKAMTVVNSLRIAAAAADGLRLRLRAFPASVSPRNQVLEGLRVL